MIRRRGGGEGVSRLDLRWEYWIWNGVEHANLQCAVMRKMVMMISDSDYIYILYILYLYILQGVPKNALSEFSRICGGIKFLVYTYYIYIHTIYTVKVKMT